MKLSIKRLNNQYEILNQKNSQDFLFHYNLHFLVQNTGYTFAFLTKDNIKIRL